jgi:prepilin-type N-terminal cleavage/methylation domain-containing protein
MKKERKQSKTQSLCAKGVLAENGFTLTEFLISSVVILSLSAGIFTMLTDVQSNSGYQTEVVNVMENTRVAMNTLGRLIVQAGSNPNAPFFTPVTITSNTKVRLCADLTGSSGGNQGDPDQDILDADEDVTIQYNSGGRTIELVDKDANVKTLARYISAFSLQYFDQNGTATTVGTDVRMIRVTITGSSTVANPRTKTTFGQTVTSDFYLPNRV